MRTISVPPVLRQDGGCERKACQEIDASRSSPRSASPLLSITSRPNSIQNPRATTYVSRLLSNGCIESAPIGPSRCPAALSVAHFRHSINAFRTRSCRGFAEGCIRPLQAQNLPLARRLSNAAERLKSDPQLNPVRQNQGVLSECALARPELETAPSGFVSKHAL